jgi:hypothetical protein
MKKQFLTILLMLFTILGNAQTKPDIPVKITKNNSTKNLFIGIGGNYSSYQDIKYSNVRYSGAGGVLTIGFNKSEDNYFWETAIEINVGAETGSTHGLTSTIINPTIYFKYLKPIKKHFKIGARLDLLDFYLRNNKELGNNGSYIITGHHLYASLMHDYKINNKWNLQSSLDLGLLSFMRESTGFAFSAPQNALEEGEFDYQNNALSNPFGYQFFEWKYFGNNINIKTSFEFQYKNRLSIGYRWSMRHFADVKSYPVTIGNHNIIFKYNIIHK